VAQFMQKERVSATTAAAILKLHHTAATAYHAHAFKVAMLEIQDRHHGTYEHIMRRPVSSWALHAIPFTTFGKYTSTDIGSTTSRFAVESSSLETFPMLQHIVETVMVNR